MAIVPKTIPVTVEVTVKRKRSWKSQLIEGACWLLLFSPLYYLLYLNLIGAK